MISGESMGMYLTVKQKHLYTNESIMMYQGSVALTNDSACMMLSYTESDRHTNVVIRAYPDELRIERNGEVITNLRCLRNKKTLGTILSEFGTIELDIYTHKYIRKENAIAVAYDILNGDEVSDGYRIIWTLKEVAK